MDVVGEIGLLGGLILLPALTVVLGVFGLSYLEDRNRSAQARGGSSRWLVTIPYAAASAAMVLMPVVLAVWAIAADEQGTGYLVSVGIVLGVLVLFVWATRPHESTFWAHWSQLPGLALTSAVGFLLTLSSYVGRGVTDVAGAGPRTASQTVATLGVAVVAGGLLALIWRRRRQGSPPDSGS